MQKHRSTSILVILFLGCTLVSITIFAGAHDQISQKALAINTTRSQILGVGGFDYLYQLLTLLWNKASYELAMALVYEKYP